MTQILTNTPVWVWVLLLALLALGLAQVPDRRVRGVVVLILPIAIVASTAFGLLAAFGPDWHVGLFALAAALAGAGINGVLLRSPRGVTWDAASNTYGVPGSWLPLLLIVVIFAARFAVGVARATRPEVLSTPTFTIAIAVLMGCCCGIFLSRATVVFQARRKARQA